MAQTIRGFLADESGSVTVEYSLLVSMIAAASIGSFEAMGETLVALLDAITAQLLAVLATIQG